MQDIAIGKNRPGSTSSADTIGTNDDERPSLTHNATSTSSEGPTGADLEKGPTGPKNRTIDEDGKIIVNWTSRGDPENPKNWPKKKKIFNVVVISLMTFLCPLCSAMFVIPPYILF
jgi:hypothetical protein